MKRESNYEPYQIPVSDPYEPYSSPPYIPPSPYGTGLDTGAQYGQGGDGQYFSDPYVDHQGNTRGVSGVGPSRSLQPLAAFTPGVPAGSLFGLRGGGSQYRGRVPYQRAFSVDLQDRLRRRRRGRLFG